MSHDPKLTLRPLLVAILLIPVGASACNERNRAQPAANSSQDPSGGHPRVACGAIASDTSRATWPTRGEFVQMDELPEAVRRVPPQYPTDLPAGTRATVLVVALVGRDGRVKDTAIVQSNPIFDDAAAASVRQWTFEPACSGGKPVAAWITVPVQFGTR